MKINFQKNKTFFLLFFIFSFFSFFSIAKPADTISYSSFLPLTNNSNFINGAPYYDPADFSGQSFPLITDDIPCVDINHNIAPGTRDYVVFGPIQKLQMFLYQNEYMKYPPTGIYLQYTYDGVRNFQRDSGLRETGIVDKYTREALKQATCQTKNNIITQVVNPAPAPVIIPTPAPNPITSYFCPLNNNYYNSQADLYTYCVNNNQMTYTVTFDATGGLMGFPIAAVNPITVSQGQSIILPSLSPVNRYNYIFDGWSTPNTIQCITVPCPSNSVTYQAGSSYIPTGNITLSANWIQSASATYTIDYAPNGADSGTPSVNTQSVNVGGTLVTASQGTLVKSGFTFAGWSTSPSGPANIPANSSYTPSSDATLYAIWSPIQNNNTTNNLISPTNVGDSIGSFYISSAYPVASNILVNFTYISCAKGYLCSQKTGQTYIYAGSAKSTTISTNYSGETIKNPVISSVSPVSDSVYTYLH